MNFFSYLYQIALILAFFGVVWKFVFIGFVAASMVWKPSFFIGKAIGYYLLVSVIALATLVATQDASAPWAFFMLFFGLIMIFFLIGGGSAEVQREMQQTMNYDGLELLRYDGMFLIGSLIFFIVAMFFPVVAVTPPVFWALYAIDWVSTIPIVGFLIALYGGWTFLGLVFSVFLYGGMAVIGSFVFLYHKMGMGKYKKISTSVIDEK